MADEQLSNLEARAKKIAEQIKYCYPANIDKEAERLTRAIVALALEAANGVPKPVLPPHDEDCEYLWDGRGYAICAEEPDVGPRPVIVFLGTKRKSAPIVSFNV